MQEYYFLFALTFIYTLFATIQDLKSREVANWLNFSFIAFALAYRAFYSISTSNSQFFLLGISGLGIFFVLAHLFYYSKAFAGGDAKLLMGYGIILPYSSYQDIIPTSLLFLFFLFLIGALYSMLFSIFIATKNKNKFEKEFKKRLKKGKYLVILSTILFIASTLYAFINPLAFLPALLFIIPLAYLYTKSLDKCMIKLLPPNKLTEGDWLEENIKVGNKMIIKSVHGLSKEDIVLLKKYKIKTPIKEGIPFVPAFLITLITMVYVFLVLQLSPSEIISSLL
jgi:Flp pilus assembly protein protease CpaA